MLSIYPACFFQEENGGYSVVFPDLNYLATQGDDFENAMEMAIECLAGYLHTCKMDGESVPSPSKLSDIDPNVIAKELDPEGPWCPRQSPPLRHLRPRWCCPTGCWPWRRGCGAWEPFGCWPGNCGLGGLWGVWCAPPAR